MRFSKSILNLLLPYFFLIGSMIVLSTPLIELINYFIVMPVGRKINTSWPKDLVIIISSLYFGWFLNARVKRPGKYHLFAVIFLITVWVRSQSVWDFENLYLLHTLSYFNCVVLCLLSGALLEYARRKPESSNLRIARSTSGFIEDNPILISDEDTFKRNVVAQKIAEILSVTANKKSFAVGILGEYGSGKTSFLNLIQNALNNREDEFVLIPFNPWSSEKPEYVQRDFFDEIAGKLTEIDPELTSLFYAYSRKLSREDDGLKKIITRINLINYFTVPHAKVSEYDKINQLLTESSKKVIVIIDDLDRLGNEEIAEVLRLIRNTADFSRLIYLVAYDKAYVQQALQSLNQKTHPSYLDKIFQLEIPLPKREYGDLLGFLKPTIKALIDGSDYEILEKGIIPDIFENQYHRYVRMVFRNSRDIVKFTNGFMLSYGLVRKEVHFKSLFFVELLRFRFPEVYNLLYDDSERFIYANHYSGVNQEYYVLKTEENGDQSIPYIGTYLKNGGQYNENDIELINALFRNLFPIARYITIVTDPAAIYNPSVFPVYFRFCLSLSSISEFEYKEAVNKGKTGLHEFADKQIAEGRVQQFVGRLLQEGKFNNKEHFELILGALLYAGPAYVQKHGFTSYPNSSLSQMLMDYDGGNVSKLYKNDRSSLIKLITDTFNDAASPYLFEAELLYHFKKSAISILGIGEEQKTQYQLGYLAKYLNSHGLDNKCNWLMWTPRSYYNETVRTGGTAKKFRLEPRIKPIIIDYFTDRDPISLLQQMIKTDMRYDNVFAIHPELIELFEPEFFRNFVASHALVSEEIKSEFLNFFDRCAEKKFEIFIPFEFKTILEQQEK